MAKGMDKCDRLYETSQQLLTGLESHWPQPPAKRIITVETRVGAGLKAAPKKHYGPQPYVGLQFSA